MCLVLWFIMIVFALVGACWCFRLVLWWVCNLRVLVFWWSWWLACGCFVWWVCGVASLWCLFAFLDFGWVCGVFGLVFWLVRFWLVFWLLWDV